MLKATDDLWRIYFKKWVCFWIESSSSCVIYNPWRVANDLHPSICPFTCLNGYTSNICFPLVDAHRSARVALSAGLVIGNIAESKFHERISMRRFVLNAYLFCDEYSIYVALCLKALFKIACRNMPQRARLAVTAAST